MTSYSPRAAAQTLLDFIAASPSPWHAVERASHELESAGFIALDETARWSLRPGARYYVTRNASALIAFTLGSDPAQGITLIGAHTDSPGLRVKPQAADRQGDLERLAVEVYGGPILATFADRDLSLAGRVVLDTPEGLQTRLLHIARPLLRLPNLAIHMNREVNEAGLKFNKQTELPPIFAISNALTSAQRFRALLAQELNCAAEALLSWELAVCDTQAGVFWGAEEEFIAAPQLDNLASCHGALRALIDSPPSPQTALIALFDHEEVGSESSAGAGGSFLNDVLERIAQQQGLNPEDQQRARRQSFFISADMAHAWHPNFPQAYEPGHRIRINGGPVIKYNANQRYSTNAESAARFMALCAKTGIPCQHYAHRSDLGCGSTIGPILAARLGIPAIDIGSPLWAMHSLRESAGAADHAWLIQALSAALQRKSFEQKKAR
ncbi:M18 family aminopeptidase [Azonexus sp.]|uniref:M18 family aminopeptidase n=1 Tax=Azonexus sp. TaxID=1872668 RepID=UPI0039E24C15